MITDTTAKKIYTIESGVTEYPIGFNYQYNPDDTPQIKLYKNKHPELPMEYGTDYEISDDGLNVVLLDNYEVGDRLVIMRDIPAVQLSDYHVGRIDPNQLESDFDEAVMRDQSLQAQLDSLAEMPIDHETRIVAIEDKIPEAASSTNQLADKNYVVTAINTKVASTNINNLADVNTTGVQDEQILTYDEASGKWIPRTSSAVATFSTLAGSPYDNAALSKELNIKTNCVTYIPEDIKFELNDGMLTLKAGSKIRVPNGFEQDGTTPKYDTITIVNDISDNFSGTDASHWYLVTYRKDTNVMNITPMNNTLYNYIRSGTSFPASALTGYVIYRTDENKIYRYDGSVWENILSLPLATISIHYFSQVVEKIHKVFNGFGYIGSVVYSLPGVKVIIPDGRNEDGTLKNIEKELPTVWTAGIVDAGEHSYNFGVLNSGGLYIQHVQVEHYDNKNNVIKWGEYVNSCCVCGTFKGSVSSASGGIGPFSFNSKAVFHAVDYSDTEFIGHQATPSKDDIAITLGATNVGYTAPADGIFSIILNAGNSASCNMYINSKLVSAFGADSGPYYNGYFFVGKGDILSLEYENCTANQFRFIYANGITRYDN